MPRDTKSMSDLTAVVTGFELSMVSCCQSASDMTVGATKYMGTASLVPHQSE